MDLPLAPANQSVTWDMLTQQQQEDYAGMHSQRGNPGKRYVAGQRLLQTCHDKVEYVVHFKLLKWYLRMGMRITQFHLYTLPAGQPLVRLHQYELCQARCDQQ